MAIPNRKPKNRWVEEGSFQEVQIHEQTAAFKLFNVVFDARVAKIHLESVELLKKRQPRGNEYGSAGRAQGSELVTVRLTIAAMSEMMLEGATVHLIHQEDAIRVYEIVTEHLRDWDAHLNAAIKPMDPPMDDLRALEAFAGAVYPYARQDFEKKRGGHVLGSMLPGLSLRERLFNRYGEMEAAAFNAEATGYDTAPLTHQTIIQKLDLPQAPVPDGIKSKWT